jgi:hypothetical protein
MTAVIIALLISLGIINSESDLNNLTPDQENQVQIVIDDYDPV